MLKNSTLQGGLLVALGAASYGMLTTFVKLANGEGFTTFELSFAQYFIGFLGLVALDFGVKQKQRHKPVSPSKKSIVRLVLAGGALGCTSLLYYFSVQFISVSIGIILLMQSVWIGVVIDAVIHKTKPGKRKLIAVAVVLIGTALATNLFFDDAKLDWRGIALGFLAAVSYSITIFSTNRVALELPTITRSKWMSLGGLLVVTLVSFPFLLQTFHPEVLLKWGVILGLLGTVLPPLLLNAGMPKVNLGVGAIITAIELPVAILMAYTLLGERVNAFQWAGVALILAAVVLMNRKKRTS